MDFFSQGFGYAAHWRYVYSVVLPGDALIEHQKRLTDSEVLFVSLRPDYQFEVSCMKSVPESIIAFLESSSYEDAIRKAISLGGDSDTMACIAGGIAEAFYGGVPKSIQDVVREKLPQEFLQILDTFYLKFGQCKKKQNEEEEV